MKEKLVHHIGCTRLENESLQGISPLSALLQILKTLALAFIVNLFVTVPAWALQSHVHPEGIYVHQMAHIFFICALAYLYWYIRRTSFSGRGWLLMQIFCILMILWNIIAFSGHIVSADLDQNDFFSDSGYWNTRLLGPITAVKLTYYLAKMDHLVCVPALFFLFLSMRSFYRDSVKHDIDEEGR